MAKKPLTEEQKEVLRERMKKAREARMKGLAERREREDIVEQAKASGEIINSYEAIKPEIAEHTAENVDISNRGTTNTEPAHEVFEAKMDLSMSESEDATSHNIEEAEETEKSEEFQPVADVAQSTQGVTLSNEQFQQLLQAFQANSNKGQINIGNQGQIKEVLEKASVNPALYVDPTDYLYDLPELKRFSMRENFVIEYKFSTIKYETAQGVWYVEPKFELTLKRKQFDPQTGEELVKKKPDGTEYKPRIVIGKALFFEDSPSNIEEATLAGLSYEDVESDTFAEKMRLWRFKNWLIERINPRPTITKTSNMREEVIGGKVYQIDEYSDIVE